MKHFSTIILFLALFGRINSQTSNFTVTNNSGTYTLSCLQTSIILTASTNITQPYSFHWSGPSFSVTAPSVTISQAGGYTVTLTDSFNVVLGTHYLTINANTIAPSSAVSPASQTITCGSNLVSVSNATGTTLSHTYISPYGGSVSLSGAVASVYYALGPGTYTHYTQDIINGCQSASTFTLVSSQGFPTFEITSPQNFTLGCNNQSVAVIALNNGNTTLPAGGPVSYTIVPISGQSQIASGTLNSASTYSLSSPGFYYAIVRDNTSLCTTQIPFSIISNTASPSLGVSVPKQILTCDSSQVTLQGYSFSPNVNYMWTYAGTPGTIFGSTIAVNINSATPSSTLLNTYTLIVTDNLNSCTSSTIIPIYQNTFLPTASIVASTNSLTCISPSVILTNVSMTGIPQNSIFSANQPVIGFLWEAPSPQLPTSAASTFTGYVVGQYTLTAKDLNNGCLNKTQINIYDGCFNSVGLQKNANDDLNIKIFPNPSKGLFSLSVDNLNTLTSVEIYNALGVLVKKQAISVKETKLDLSSEANGLYFIYLIQDKRVLQTKKIIKE